MIVHSQQHQGGGVGEDDGRADLAIASGAELVIHTSTPLVGTPTPPVGIMSVDGGRARRRPREARR